MSVLGGVILVGFAILGCREFTDWRKASAAPKDAFKDVVAALVRLTQSSEYVEKVQSSYRLWPRGTYDSITYDGAICTFVTPLPARDAFHIRTSMFIKGTWEVAEDAEIPALAFRNALQRRGGAVLGIPMSARRALAESHIHRRYLCGIELPAPPTVPPAP